MLRGRVFRGTWAVEQGLLTKAQLRSSAWRRLRADVYADAAEPCVHRLHARGVALVMPRAAALAGRTAADLLGVPGAAGPGDPVEVTLRPGTRWDPQPGIVVRTAPLAGDVVARGPFLRWTSGLRTAVDVARFAPPDDAVVLLDQLVHAGAVQLDAVRAAVAALPTCRGVARARRAVAAADGRAESPQETRLRLFLAAHGLPAPVSQFEVRVAGRFVARVDFAWPERRVALEYDGAWHAEPGQFGRDRQRLTALAAAGWRVLFVTAVDLRRPVLLLARLADALA
ncbi:endonuclease domain-containing protein [Modestobacter sp. SYSU DS0290]